MPKSGARLMLQAAKRAGAASTSLHDRTADRPEFQVMLARSQRDRDVQVVIVHKVDRFARNLEDHVTTRALLRRLG